MSISQPAIIAPTAQFALFVLFKVKGCASRVLSESGRLHALIEELKLTQIEAELKACLAFSPDFCRANHISVPDNFMSFRPLGRGDNSAPSTDCDVLLHLHSHRYDLNFYVLRKFMALVSDDVDIVDETHTFRYLDSRDLTGFIDGTENPQEEQERRDVAIIQEGECAGGSIVMVQRYVHRLSAWNALNVAQQEKVIGRTKPDSIELGNKETTSHVSRVDIKEGGESLSMLRHSLPYGTVSGEHGLLFIAYACSQHITQTLLESMFGERDGKTDQLLSYTTPVTGAYFFAPSLSVLTAFINE